MLDGRDTGVDRVDTAQCGSLVAQDVAVCPADPANHSSSRLGLGHHASRAQGRRLRSRVPDRSEAQPGAASGAGLTTHTDTG
ncbi:Uncharacterised protein [Mycobacterium tuberculosis]|nr:Uncharacterised protein [Mycobacterium tuberculosis]CNW75603.1 Uncharacterised protein [Mycobacterium tuberculosis]